MIFRTQDANSKRKPRNLWFNWETYMNRNSFTLIFEKVASASVESTPEQSLLPSEATPTEIDEIAELRRLVLEITEPEPMSYTTT